MDTTDKETKEQLTLADHVRSMLDSDGWKYVKEKFDARILDMQSIRNLDIDKPETLSIQLAARNLAIDLMMEWWEKDVKGFIEQQDATLPLPTERPEDFVDRG